MDLNYLSEKLLPQRAKEIKQGKNLGNRNVIYVVLGLQEHCIGGHEQEYGINTNLKGKNAECGYYDSSKDEPEFSFSDKRMKTPKEVTRFYTDYMVAFFLTSKEAHAYLKYQSHNIRQGYVYATSAGYANREMNNLLKNE